MMWCLRGKNLVITATPISVSPVRSVLAKFGQNTKGASSPFYDRKRATPYCLFTGCLGIREQCLRKQVSRYEYVSCLSLCWEPLLYSSLFPLIEEASSREVFWPSIFMKS